MKAPMSQRALVPVETAEVVEVPMLEAVEEIAAPAVVLTAEAVLLAILETATAVPVQNPLPVEMMKVSRRQMITGAPMILNLLLPVISLISPMKQLVKKQIRMIQKPVTMK